MGCKPDIDEPLLTNLNIMRVRFGFTNSRGLVRFFHLPPGKLCAGIGRQPHENENGAGG
jgi:hypothetical protein